MMQAWHRYWAEWSRTVRGRLENITSVLRFIDYRKLIYNEGCINQNLVSLEISLGNSRKGW